MSLDARIALALAVQSHKGVYAVLLGSGVSRSASIPSGWDVVLELARRLATAEGKDTKGDPAGWYTERFGESPTYSKLVTLLAPTGPERLSLLKGFFEPTAEEREEGKKQPTAAHLAIAQLVSRGYIRVICTTNFDRLMERALEEVGVSPTVVSTPDQVQGMMPPQHTGCLVVKIHGDYLDTRLRNTTDELASYDPQTDGLLSRILTEYGLIVCGWSGDWDTALVDAISRTTTHRFSTFWMARGKVSGRAEELSRHRRASVVPIESADEAFHDLLDKVLALEAGTVADPISPQVAVATMKRYLAAPAVNRIRLEEFVMAETRGALERSSRIAVPEDSPIPTPDLYRERVGRIETAMSKLVPMVAVGAKWGDADLYPLWGRAIGLLAKQESRGGYTWWSFLRSYPATLLLYAVGTMAAASDNYELLRVVLVESKSRRQDGDKPKPLALLLCAIGALHHDGAQSLFSPDGNSRRRTPGSDHIEVHLREAIGHMFDDPAEFQRAFDRFEMVLALAVAALGDHPPLGSFLWRHELGESSYAAFSQEIEARPMGHPIFSLGVFSEMQEFKDANAKVIESLGRRTF